MKLKNEYYNVKKHTSNGNNTILLDSNNKIIAYSHKMCDYGNSWDYVRADCRENSR